MTASYNPFNDGKYLLADDGETILEGSGACCGYDETFTEDTVDLMAIYCCED